MKNIIKTVYVESKKFVKNHKVACAVVATAVYVSAGYRREISGYDNFLETHGLLEEFNNQ